MYRINLFLVKARVLGAVAATICLLSISLSVQAQDGPAIWKVERGEATAYIMGTIHLMTPETDWYSERVASRFESAGTLVLEVDMLGPEIVQAQQLAVENSRLPAGQTLADFYSDEEYARLVSVATGVGIPSEALTKLRPWLVSLQLSLVSAQAAGFLQQYGVDLTLLTRATQADKPVIGLESAIYQMGLIIDMDDTLLARMILDELDQIADLEGMFIEMRDLWLTGDTETLGALINESFTDEDMAEKLLYQRNRNWVGRLEEILATPGVYFIAVGTGHLAGKNNYIQLLEDAGFSPVLE